MGPILKLDADQAITDDWEIYSEAAGELASQGHWVLPWEIWKANSSQFAKSDNRAPYLNADLDPSEISSAVLGRTNLVGIYFDQFFDGRGLSLAVALRRDHLYQGELRAMGDILPDIVNYLMRCGFDSFLLRNLEEFKEAKHNLELADQNYQGSVIDPKPLFRKFKRKR